MAALVAALLALAVWRGILLIRAGGVVGVVLGAAVMVVVAVGGWALWRSVFRR